MILLPSTPWALILKVLLQPIPTSAIGRTFQNHYRSIAFSVLSSKTSKTLISGFMDADQHDFARTIPDFSLIDLGHQGFAPINPAGFDLIGVDDLHRSILKLTS